jgi:selenium-binding protein 1
MDVPAEPADLKEVGAVPPLVTEINLSLDDRFLYAPCWDTGELRQCDVSDPFDPRHTTSVHLGGIVRRTPHPRSEEQSGASLNTESMLTGARSGSAGKPKPFRQEIPAKNPPRHRPSAKTKR